MVDSTPWVKLSGHPGTAHVRVHGVDGHRFLNVQRVQRNSANWTLAQVPSGALCSFAFGKGSDSFEVNQPKEDAILCSLSASETSEGRPRSTAPIFVPSTRFAHSLVLPKSLGRCEWPANSACRQKVGWFLSGFLNATRDIPCWKMGRLLVCVNPFVTRTCDISVDICFFKLPTRPVDFRVVWLQVIVSPHPRLADSCHSLEHTL